MELILIRGLPGSGKSTLANNLCRGAFGVYNHFEADQFFYVDGEYKFDPSKLQQAHQQCQESTRQCLGWDQSVIVSNTFTTCKELEPYFEIAKEYDITPIVLLCQNNLGSIHRVPEEVLNKMRRRFQYDISELWF